VINTLPEAMTAEKANSITPSKDTTADRCPKQYVATTPMATTSLSVTVPKEITTLPDAVRAKKAILTTPSKDIAAYLCGKLNVCG